MCRRLNRQGLQRMLTFIIPVISKDIADDWELVMSNLKKTLISVGNQTTSDWRVLIVSQTKPDINYIDNRIIFVHAPFEPARKYPKNLKLSAVKRAVCRRANDLDRVRKIRTAAESLHNFKTDFIMLLEADDLVSNQLCEFVENNRDANGWSFKKGFIWDGSSNYMLQTDRFTSLSGSSWVVKVFYEMLPKSITIEVDPSTLSLFPSGCPFLDNGHRNIEAAMSGLGKPLQTLPFHGSVYHWGHGANLSQQHNKYAHLSPLGKIRRWLNNISFDFNNMKNRVDITESLESEFTLRSQPNIAKESCLATEKEKEYLPH